MIVKSKLYVTSAVVLLGLLFFAFFLSGIVVSPALAAYPTRTRTPTKTRTPVGPTRTPTRGPTPTPTPTATITPTPVSGAVCSPLTATITAPFVLEIIGKVTSNDFCWRISSLGSINSFGLDLLTVNGVNLTNMWVAATGMPPQIGGYWYIHYVATNKITQHFDAQP